ncbi:MAG: hypothetical protein JJE25_06755 [Bacteroidia bacterium]|nr:hypothetical protein [Bacteroidia bacterium]
MTKELIDVAVVPAEENVNEKQEQVEHSIQIRGKVYCNHVVVKNDTMKYSIHQLAENPETVTIDRNGNYKFNIMVHGIDRNTKAMDDFVFGASREARFVNLSKKLNIDTLFFFYKRKTDKIKNPFALFLTAIENNNHRLPKIFVQDLWFQ